MFILGVVSALIVMVIVRTLVLSAIAYGKESIIEKALLGEMINHEGKRYRMHVEELPAPLKDIHQ